jgi:hypothetical protein
MYESVDLIDPIVEVVVWLVWVARLLSPAR